MAPVAGRSTGAGLGQRAGGARGKAAGRASDAQDADGEGVERRAEAGGGAGAQGQCVCHRPEASALDPRAAPNGDVLVAESNQVAGPARSVFSYAMQATMRRARALGVSANRITLLRATDGDGVAERRETFMEGLS